MPKRITSSVPPVVAKERRRFWEEAFALRQAGTPVPESMRLELYLRFVATVLGKPYEPQRFQAMYWLLRSRFGPISFDEPPKYEFWETAYEVSEADLVKKAQTEGGKKGAKNNTQNKEIARQNRRKVERAAQSEDRPSQREVAERLNLSRETVRKYWPPSR